MRMWLPSRSSWSGELRRVLSLYASLRPRARRLDSRVFARCLSCLSAGFTKDRCEEDCSRRCFAPLNRLYLLQATRCSWRGHPWPMRASRVSTAVLVDRPGGAAFVFLNGFQRLYAFTSEHQELPSIHRSISPASRRLRCGCFPCLPFDSPWQPPDAAYHAAYVDSFMSHLVIV